MNADEKTDDTPAVTDAESDAAFGAGFDGVAQTERPPGDEGKIADKPAKLDKPAPEKPDPAATPRAKETPAPEYIQITAKDWADVRAAAAKTASYDQQLSKAFGTIGNLQKMVNGFQAQTPPASPATPPAARKVEISRAAFAEMEKDFPELAQQTRAALEAALSGLPSSGGADVDASTIEGMLAQYTAKREIEALDDAYPDWRDIVGAVDVTKQQPDPDNPFRKWLADKEPAYQTKIHSSENAAVLSRAIRLFQKETAASLAQSGLRATPKVNGTRSPHETARADRIRAAVQPRGDNAGAAASKSEDDEFVAGFSSR